MSRKGSPDKERERQDKKEKQFISELLGIKYQSNIDLIQKVKMINEKINEKRKDWNSYKHKLMEKEIMGGKSPLSSVSPVTSINKRLVLNNSNEILKIQKNLVLSSTLQGNGRNFYSLTNKHSSENTTMPVLPTQNTYGNNVMEVKETFGKYNYPVTGNNSPHHNSNYTLLGDRNYSNPTPYQRNLQVRINQKRVLKNRLHTRSVAFSNQCIYNFSTNNNSISDNASLIENPTKIMNMNFDIKTLGMNSNSLVKDGAVHYKKTLSTIFTSGNTNGKSNRNRERDNYYNKDRNSQTPFKHDSRSLHARIQSDLSKILSKENLADTGRNHKERNYFINGISGSYSKSPSRGLPNNSSSESNTSVNSIINNIHSSFMNTKSTITAGRIPYSNRVYSHLSASPSVSSTNRGGNSNINIIRSKINLNANSVLFPSIRNAQVQGSQSQLIKI